MDKKYTEIDFVCGDTIEKAVNTLLDYKDKGKLVFGTFNGTKLYSDTVTMDDAYISITGKTKAERDVEHKKWIEESKKEEEAYKNTLPKLIEEWKEKGRKILTEENIIKWDEIVPIRANDLYRGMELDASLDIIGILNNDGSLDEAKEKIESQNHSGMSFSLVCSMVKELCNRGNEFVEYVR